MKRCFIAFFAVVLLMFSCTGKKSGQLDEVPADSVADSIDTTEVDSLEMLIAETPMPRAADAMFDDFIFNFVANKKLQKERVVFPLRTREGEKVSMTEKDQWKMEHFFMRQGYYTLLFDSDEQMSHQKDTAISEAIVEKIQLRKKRVTSYYFVRIKGAWMMKEVVVTPIAENPNASFLEFYQRFVTDSAYQVAHLNKTVTFISPDPDDDFTMMEGVITPETWSAFAPTLPSKVLYNIVYGKPKPVEDQMIFLMRGVANGLEMELITHLVLMPSAVVSWRLKTNRRRSRLLRSCVRRIHLI